MTLINTAIRLPENLSRRVLSIAYTPDSDDAFNYFGWEHGKIALAGVQTDFHREHIIALNRAAQAGRYDVVGVSSAVYPTVADKYWILSAGNSVGRGYGPVLVSSKYRTLDQLRGKRIGVGGIWTTGAALAAMYCSRAELFAMRYDHIADAVLDGTLDAGVMIHEELLFFGEKGLHAIADLGAAWCKETRLPLPVGLNLVRKSLGRELASQIAEACRASLEWSLGHFDEVFEYASRFGRGCAKQHISMFSNQDTLRLAEDVRVALGVMFDRVASNGLGPRLSEIEVIDG